MQSISRTQGRLHSGGSWWVAAFQDGSLACDPAGDKRCNMGIGGEVSNASPARVAKQRETEGTREGGGGTTELQHGMREPNGREGSTARASVVLGE